MSITSNLQKESDFHSFAGLKTEKDILQNIVSKNKTILKHIFIDQQ